MNRINWNGAGYKEWIGLLASPVFWVASLVCFVFGLNFSQGSGIYIPGTNTDILILFSLGLGLANTAIQIVGNDSTKEELGMALYLMWGASYMLGIGSNVNFLYGVIGLSHWLLQFLVCWGLGIMIEVAPERLLVRFLRSIGVLKPVQVQYTAPRQVSTSQQQPQRMPPQRNMPEYPRPFQEPRGTGEYPTYHPVSTAKEDLPPFMRQEVSRNEMQRQEKVRNR